jgi:ketosteroid isomerase-like protein
MSQENLEVVRELFAAFDSQDWAVALGFFDPAVEWSAAGLGTHRGPEGVVSSLAEWFEPWKEHEVEAEEFAEAGDQVLVVVRLTGRGASSNMEIDQRFFQLYSVGNGKITRMVEFVTREQALDAAGLRE